MDPFHSLDNLKSQCALVEFCRNSGVAVTGMELWLVVVSIYRFHIVY